MNKYDIVYEHQADSQYSFWIYATERIKARGIVHAQRLATDHMKELKKTNKNPMRVGKIRQVIDDAD